MILWGVVPLGVGIVAAVLINNWQSRDHGPWIASRFSLQSIGTAYRDFHKQHHRPPAKFEDLDDIERDPFHDKISKSFPRAAEDFEIYWNTPLSEDDAENAGVILGYAKNFTSRGVVVLRGNGVTTTVSVHEFENMKQRK